METFDTVDTMLTDIDPYRSAYARSRRSAPEHGRRGAGCVCRVFHGAYGPDLVGIKLGMSFAEAEAAVRQHMAVAAKYRRSVADDVARGGNAARPPGTGVLFVSAANDEMIGVFDAPPAAEGQVVAVWRRIYSPLAVDFDLVTRRSTEKYGPPAFQDDGGRLLAWGAGPPICGAGDAAAFDTRATLDARWTDERGEPLRFHAANGEDNPTMPLIAVIAAAPPPGQSCAPRLRLVFRSEQGDPPMNVSRDHADGPRAASARSPGVARAAGTLGPCQVLTETRPQNLMSGVTVTAGADEASGGGWVGGRLVVTVLPQHAPVGDEAQRYRLARHFQGHRRHHRVLNSYRLQPTQTRLQSDPHLGEALRSLPAER